MFYLAFGGKQQQFEKFAESVAGTKGFLVAEVPMTDVGDRNNDDLARKYNVKRAEYPVYKLFLKKLYKPVDYTGDKTEADLKRFVSQHSSKTYSNLFEMILFHCLQATGLANPVHSKHSIISPEISSMHRQVRTKKVKILYYYELNPK